MKVPHEKFCVLPWISMETSPTGTVRPCCLAEDEIVDDNGKPLELASTPFSEIQNSNHMKTLRQEFLGGKRPKTCQKCWDEEDAGRTSKRMHTLDRLKHMISDNIEWGEDAEPLMFLDLKLGNICNLKCRICGSWSSSAFATEELQNIPRERKKSSFQYMMLKKGAWPREKTEFWSELEDILSQIRYIEFTGGEPFMIGEHFDLLKKLVDRGISPNVEIHYNTNGTHFPEHAIDIWKNFKHVEVAFSIDDVGERFEYQRTNAVWSEVQNNIFRFKQLRSELTNMSLQVCSTVNAYNVYYLADLAQWIDEQNFDFIYWNMLHEPSYLSVSRLPQKAKTAAIESLKNCDVTQHHRQEFDHIIDFIANGDTTDGKELRDNIKQLDERRDVNLENAHPEWANILDYG
jgi:organic radical activating enzyme